MLYRTRWMICLSVVVVSLLSACSSGATPAPTATALPPTATIELTATATAAPTATFTATPAPTATPTETRQPTATSTPVPSATATATKAATSTPKATATLKPTSVPVSLTPTTVPAAPAGAVPPPEVFQFSGDGFRKYLDYAHQKYQNFLDEFGSIAKGDHLGYCNMFFLRRNDILGIVAFTGAPDPWTAMVDEFNAFRTEALVAIEPINVVCQGGGGRVPEDVDRHIIDVFDRAQNRMYQMLQAAKTMP
jgi:hypothetical protein